MKNKTLSPDQKEPRETIGEQVRKIADRLQQEKRVQIKATSRILGAAAQIAENQDRLIDEVVDIVNEDLEQKKQLDEGTLYTVDLLKKKYRTLREAKTHFRMKAKSWALLVDQLNHQISLKLENLSAEHSVPDRLTAIENEIKQIHSQIRQIMCVLEKILVDRERQQ